MHCIGMFLSFQLICGIDPTETHPHTHTYTPTHAHTRTPTHTADRYIALVREIEPNPLQPDTVEATASQTTAVATTAGTTANTNTDKTGEVMSKPRKEAKKLAITGQ